MTLTEILLISIVSMLFVGCVMAISRLSQIIEVLMDINHDIDELHYEIQKLKEEKPKTTKRTKVK